MTKEELKREAKEYADKYGKSNFDLWDTARFAYYQGAESREKRIAELEKENADLKEEINKIAFARGNLEEENAELKGLKDVATLIRANNDTVTTLMQLNNMLVSKNQQLTKAKELLKQWLQTSKASGCDNINIVTNTEQFLKDN